MPVIQLTTHINAPIAICFDLSRSIELHELSTSATNEKAIAGCTRGLINLQETVTWQATHFGIRQQLTSRITALDYPHRFTDEMVKGAFRCFRHDHIFTEKEDRTIMEDRFDFESPLGILGKLANQLVLTRYLTRLLTHRNTLIKQYAENGEWQKILPREKRPY